MPSDRGNHDAFHKGGVFFGLLDDESRRQRGTAVLFPMKARVVVINFIGSVYFFNS
jgi:hypothetical protein